MKKPATILSEFDDKPETIWPGLFRLYRNPDGTRRAEFEPAMALREWELRWKLSPVERQLARAFMFLNMAAEWSLPAIPEPKHLAPFGGSNVFEVHKAAMMLQSVSEFIKRPVDLFSESIGNELKTVTDPAQPKAKRSNAKKKILQSITRTLEALVERGERKAHGSATIVEEYYGEALLAWSVLDATRRLVDRHHELPTKKAAKAFLIGREKKLGNVSPSQWAAAFNAAGLESLPRASTRKVPSRKRPRSC